MKFKESFNSLDEAQYYFGNLNIRELEIDELVEVMFITKAIHENITHAGLHGAESNFWYTLSNLCDEILRQRNVKMLRFSKENCQTVLGLVGITSLKEDSKIVREMISCLDNDDLQELIDSTAPDTTEGQIIAKILQQERNLRFHCN